MVDQNPPVTQVEEKEKEEKEDTGPDDVSTELRSTALQKLNGYVCIHLG